MEDLPVELTIDILSRLPVKTIIHCKLVCKKWRDLVSDSSFVNLHLSRSPTGFVVHHKPRVYRNGYLPPGTLKWVEIEDKVDHHHLYHDRLLSFDLNLVLILDDAQMRHVGSFNGLICLWQYSLKYNLDDTYICNPITREYMLLPRQHSPTDGFPEVVYGFGVSSLTGEYKVIRAFQARPNVLEAEVYTLGTGHWRSLSPIPVTYLLNTSKQFHGPFLNNSCHWIVDYSKDPRDNILTFDLDTETFQLLPSPPESGQRKRCYVQSLSILKGCLCKLNTYHSELTIWVMKEYGIKNSWHNEVVITREICVDLKWLPYKPIHLIVGLKDGSILMVFEDKLRENEGRVYKLTAPTQPDCALQEIATKNRGFVYALTIFEDHRNHFHTDLLLYAANIGQVFEESAVKLKDGSKEDVGEAWMSIKDGGNWKKPELF
ncbi:hypothetical protein OSB04_015856 [Centaurea solstitialis]|uniref:F-box domain-containing protein n=1 Tax=Centaurea solstitialis TaxID=347529 RepID=A0AA38WKI2_9ASTR|nr:hypothetical protein OSB04_015856 [Centaurea solstitialis]